MMKLSLQSEIRRILNENQIVRNASRKDFLGLYLPALVQSNSVQFYKTAKSFPNGTYLTDCMVDSV